MGTTPDPESPVIYLRYVPKELKRKLIESAAGRNLSLNSYVIAVLEEAEDAARVREGE